MAKQGCLIITKQLAPLGEIEREGNLTCSATMMKYLKRGICSKRNFSSYNPMTDVLFVTFNFC